MGQKTKVLRDPSRVLVFNSMKRLVGIFASQNAAAKLMGISAPAIKKACDGIGVSSKGHYFRNWRPEEVDIDIASDWGNVTVDAYDELVGLNRKYYSSNKMTRKGLKLKYNMVATPDKLIRSKKYEESKSKDNQ